MNAPKTDGLDETYAKMALRILIGPRDMEWHNIGIELLDSGPDYGLETDENGDHKQPKDIYEVAGRILGYCAGLVPWTPEPI